MRKGDLKHYINSLEQMEETTICSHELMRDQKKKKKSTAKKCIFNSISNLPELI